MGPKEYLKIAKEVAKPLYDKIEEEIRKNLLENNSDIWYSIQVSDELKLEIERSYAIWQTVADMYISQGWKSVILSRSFFRCKLTITFMKDDTYSNVGNG